MLTSTGFRTRSTPGRPSIFCSARVTQITRRTSSSPWSSFQLTHLASPLSGHRVSGRVPSPLMSHASPADFFGYDDAPEGHCEVIYKDVRVPIGNLMLGWGRGFEIMQGRMGPARTHLWYVGRLLAYNAGSYILAACELSGWRSAAWTSCCTGRPIPQESRSGSSYTVGCHARALRSLTKPAEHQTVATEIAQSRIEIDQIRFIVLNAAHAVGGPLYL
jgi:hypothetical protein